MYAPTFCAIDKNNLRIDACELRRRLMLPTHADVSEYEKAVETLLSESTPKACFVRVPVAVKEDLAEFPFMEIKSRNLSKNLSGCATLNCSNPVPWLIAAVMAQISLFCVAKSTSALPNCSEKSGHVWGLSAGETP